MLSPSTVKIALGLAGIALGFRQIKNGMENLATASPQPRQRPMPRRQQSGARRIAVPSDGHVMTPSGPLRLRTYPIRNLNDRIKRLRDRIEEGKRDPMVYEFARRAVNKRCGSQWCVPEKDTLGELRALFAAIRNNVRYTSDIRGVDSYQNPGKTLMLNGGDCDDYSTLSCSTAASIGIPCRLKVIRTRDSGDWNHIYAQMGLPRQRPMHWVSFDASVNKPFGWEAPPQMVAASKVFRVV